MKRSHAAVLRLDSRSTPERPSPAGVPGRIRRNGFARAADLKTVAMREALAEMEAFQMDYMAATRELWTPSFAFTGDCLYNWSRRWEYPYCWLNLEAPAGARVLDAGSGITFFPFFLERAGLKVACADIDPALAGAFDLANRRLGGAVDYHVCGIEALDFPDRSFDAVACVSVLEHAPRRADSVAELARVLKPGGRLAITWDVSLSRDGDVLMEDVADLLARLRSRFEPVYPLDPMRPPGLLTTDRVRAAEPWRLSWRPRGGWLRRAASRAVHGDSFRSIAVMGSVWERAE